ncbi:MAG: glycosyltransferase [Euryarchaeota archaeon]|nr:glycosyltransferase [Euryarchaeota archaeon]
MAGIEPFVSVVITVKNAGATIRRCMDSLLAMDYPRDLYEIIVVDAFSTDGTWETLQEYAKRTQAPEIRTLQKIGTIGVGRNEGIRNAKGTFVAITDADMEVSRDWVRELLRGFTWGEGIAAVGGPNNTATRGLTVRTVSCLPVHGPTLDEVHLLRPNRYRKKFVSGENIYTNVTRNSMFRREALLAVGLFDEELVVTEDPELNRRLLNAGHKAAYNPAAVVLHHHRDSLPAFYLQQARYAYWQAVANRKQPKMAGVKQWLPAVAAITFLVLLAGAYVSDAAALALAGVIVLVVAFLLAYAAKCAIVKRNIVLMLTIPVFYLAWQLAWAINFPAGVLGMRPP